MRTFGIHHRRAIRLFCTALTAVIVSRSTALAQESPHVELVVRLQDGSRYSLHDLMRELNCKQGAAFDLKQIPDRAYELTDRQRRLLQLLGLFGDQTDGVRVQVTDAAVIISVPDRESPEVREQQRQRIGRWLGVRLKDWPVNQGLRKPDPFDPRRRTVVLVPGLESRPETLGDLQRAFEADGIQILLFDYPNDGPLEESGRRLRTELLALEQSHPTLRTVLIGHSMGGLVCRNALEAPGERPQGVTDLFTLGTPHAGATLANGQPWLDLIDGLPSPQYVLWRTLQDGLGEAGVDLLPGSRFLTRLNSWAPAPHVTYRAGRGRQGFVDPQALAALRERLQRRLEDRPGLTLAGITGLLTDFEQVQTEQGDGVVSLSSAALEGAAEIRTFDLNHLELVRVPLGVRHDAPVYRWILDSLGWSP